MTALTLYLASASPRRRELLAQIGVECRVLAVDLDESPLPGEPPEVYVRRLALDKARAALALVAPRDGGHAGGAGADPGKAPRYGGHAGGAGADPGKAPRYGGHAGGAGADPGEAPRYGGHAGGAGADPGKAPRYGGHAGGAGADPGEDAVSGWQASGALVLAADTAVVVDTQVLGKPRDAGDAAAMLRLLSGREHRVLSGVALVGPGAEATSAVSESRVRMRPIAEAEITAYWATGEPADKAGGYAIQGRAAVFVEALSGSYSGVMGLPLFETSALLAAAGLAPLRTTRSTGNH